MKPMTRRSYAAVISLVAFLFFGLIIYLTCPDSTTWSAHDDPIEKRLHTPHHASM